MIISILFFEMSLSTALWTGIIVGIGAPWTMAISLLLHSLSQPLKQQDREPTYKLADVRC